jgi:hypothetical protein
MALQSGAGSKNGPIKSSTCHSQRQSQVSPSERVSSSIIPQRSIVFPLPGSPLIRGDSCSGCLAVETPRCQIFSSMSLSTARRWCSEYDLCHGEDWSTADPAGTLDSMMFPIVLRQLHK